MFGPGGIHPVQLLIVLALALLFFGGRGRISAMMGDLANGLKSFRQGLKDDDEEDADSKSIDKSKEDPINVTPSKDETKV